MTLDWLYKLSDWNPQLFREVKGRVKPRTFTFAAIASLLSQLMLLGCFGLDLPDRLADFHHRCTGTARTSYPSTPICMQDSAGYPIVNWQGWWTDVFQALTWILPFVLLLAGVYMLIGDLGKEERRGTLNFIRLSPQHSHHILLGKVLGVPIVPYLVVALAVPLHLMAAISGGVSPLRVVSIYLVTIAACGFFYAASLLYGTLGGFQGWVGAIAVWFGYSVFWQIWQVTRYSTTPLYAPIGQWFYLEIGKSLLLTLLFMLTTLGVGTFWMWQAVNRRFRNPTATLLSKRQSYLSTVCVEVFLIGFAFRTMETWERPIDTLGILLFLNLLWFGVMIAALSPHRQALLDWTRFRRERISQGKRFWSRSILSELLWGEKSPSLLAIGLNLLIAIAILAPWVLTWKVLPGQIGRALAGLVLGAMFMLTCAAIAQLLLLMKSPKRAAWATGTVGALIILPPIVLQILAGGVVSKAPVFWMFTAFSLVALDHASLLTILFGLVGQVSILTVLTARLSRQLQQAGESESKALLAGV